MAVTEYFLGGNTAKGFFSLYDDFCAGEEDFLWILKGGPGCGKSSFMRRIGKAAEQSYLDVEYVRCSGDPSSVDGVYIPAWKTGYVDGTAPHVIEPMLPGAKGLYVDLGRYYDRKALTEKRAQLQALTAGYKAQYTLAYEALRQLPMPEIPRLEMPGKRRFASAFTCQGMIRLEQTREPEETVWYLHPVWPEYAEAVWIPEENRRIRLPILPEPEIETAAAHLALAKQVHDELEEVYNPHVDFDGIYALAQIHIARLKQENSSL